MRIRSVLVSLVVAVPGCALPAPGSVDSSPLSSPLPTATASERVPSLSAAPTATPASSEMLPPGAMARVAVDSLRLRSDAGTNAPIVASMPRGAVVYLTGPPFERSVDGVQWRFMWYAPGWADWPSSPRDFQAGWAATEDSENAYLILEPIHCPPGTPDIETLLAMTDWAHVECLGDGELVVEGTVMTGFGGFAPGVYEPTWLAAPFGFSGAIQTDAGQFFYHLEGGGQAAYPDGQRLRITGHYDHPAARTCTIATGEPPIPEPDDFAVAYCRARFVATAIEELAG